MTDAAQAITAVLNGYLTPEGLAGQGGPFSEINGAEVVRRLAAAGFVVVPREPTEAMVEAGCGAAMRYEFHMTDGGTVAMVWAAMLAAAQTPPADTHASGPQTARLCVKPDF